MQNYYTQLRFDMLWEEKFNLLLRYRDMYGTVNVPNRYSNMEIPEWERKLGSWVCTQRQKYKKDKLLQWRNEKLVAVDFLFDPFETYFEEHFSDFLKFKEKYGHALVPQNCDEYPSLGTWVSHLRTKPVNEERKIRLNAAGFVWNQISEIWQIRFREIAAFIKENGHCIISEKKKGLEILGTWVVRMRKAKKYGKGQIVNEEQIRLLESIGFVWEPEEEKWEKNYNNLKTFYLEYNHCYVPIRRCNIEGLGWWVSWLRKNKHKLTENQIKQLDEINFEWNSDIAYRKRNNIKGIND